MSYIPNCREDEYYNQKYLKTNDSEFLRGFDWAVEMAVINFFDSNYTDCFEDGYLEHLLTQKIPVEINEEYDFPLTFSEKDGDTRRFVIKTYADMLKSEILRSCETERDALITSMIDNYPEDEYKAIKEKVDGKEE